MSFLEYNVKFTPTGWRKILYLNWPLIVLLIAVAGVGFLMLTSVAGGRIDRWAEPQIVIRFWIISLILAMIGLATLKVR